MKIIPIGDTLRDSANANSALSSIGRKRHYHIKKNTLPVNLLNCLRRQKYISKQTVNLLKLSIQNSLLSI